MKILIAGSTGFVGTNLVIDLEKQNHEVFHLVTTPKGLNNEILWNPDSGFIEKDKIPHIDVVINLAGYNISKTRWSSKIKHRILNSRVKSTKLLLLTLQEFSIRPTLWINASAVGYYGGTGDYLNVENDSPGNDFLSKVCVEWELEANNAKSICERVVILRFGVILDKRGGVLNKLLPIFRFCAGGKLGNGKQYFSWVSLKDVISVINHAINSKISGVYNVVSPEVITNEGFTDALGEALKKPTITRVPAIVLKLKYGQMAKETMLQSCKASPDKIIDTGFEFKNPNIFLFLKKQFQSI